MEQKSSIEHHVPFCRLGGMKISCLSQQETADFMADVVDGKLPELETPLFMTSSNGQVLSKYASDDRVREVYDRSDLISADGQPMVMMSRLLLSNPVKDRCSTTDLFPAASKRFSAGTRYYMLGASRQEIEAAVAAVKRDYPHIDIVGYSDGYFSEAEESELVDAINALEPDVLWIGLGVPRQQEFVVRNIDRLTKVKIIKTVGGLFNFLSGKNSRAPDWMQKFGMEWLYRLSLEPKRLFWRYLISNPHSLYLLLTKTEDLNNCDERNFAGNTS